MNNPDLKKRIPICAYRRIKPLNRLKASASLTVEAALVLPIFLFMMISLIYLAEAIRFSGNVQASLMQSAKKLSAYSYAYQRLSGKGGLGAGSTVVSLTVGRSMTVADLGNKYIGESPVKGGAGGLSFLHSSVLDKDQMIDLVAVYEVKAPFSFLGISAFKVADRARIRAFTGYDNTKKEDVKEDEEIVFITEYGTVYHRSRNCSHLKLTIKETSLDKVGGERNAGGAKYYPCEFCGKKGKTGRIYITEDGDRYHTSLTCSGLKRSIQAVRISEVGGRPPCSTCGGR